MNRRIGISLPRVLNILFEALSLVQPMQFKHCKYALNGRKAARLQTI